MRTAHAEISARIDEYLNYLAVERGASLNTLEAYSRDIRQFLEYAAQRGIASIVEVKAEHATAFLGDLREQGLSSTSMNRKLAAIRGYFKHLLREGRLEENPLARIRIGRSWMASRDSQPRGDGNPSGSAL